MTLITYPTRVHFADGVLQEALHSELERTSCSRPTLIFEQILLESEFYYRVLEGLPLHARPQSLIFDAKTDAGEISKQVLHPKSDIVISFGSAAAIRFGQKCRRKLALDSGIHPKLHAIPGIDGLPGPCNHGLESWRASLPDVVICDPTVALHQTPEKTWQAIVLSLARCIEAYLAVAFNPPADGMALDGLNRCVSNLTGKSKKSGIDLQREVMAASLNAALSLEKGVGPTQVLAAALTRKNKGLNQSDLIRLILPIMVASHPSDAAKVEVLLKVLGKPGETLAKTVQQLLGAVPLVAPLSKMGLMPDDLDVAAKSVAGMAGLNYANARDVLEQVY